MRCPDDGGELRAEPDGGWSCDGCRGQLIARVDLARTRPHAAGLLRPEEDGDSGAFARMRLCPRCGTTMMPQRIGDQLAWLEACAGCDLLWIEKLDVAVMDRLAKRAAVVAAVEAMPAADRRELARSMASEVAEQGRLVRMVKRIVAVLHGLTGW